MKKEIITDSMCVELLKEVIIKQINNLDTDSKKMSTLEVDILESMYHEIYKDLKKAVYANYK